MNNLGRTLGLFGLGVLLVVLNGSGSAGCGSGSGGGGGTGITNAGETAAELATVLGDLATFANTSSAALKAVTSGCTGDPSTGLTCPCAGGGSTTFTFGSSNTDDLVFNNCVDDKGNTLNGDAPITTTSTSRKINVSNFSAVLASCGSAVVSGTENIVDNGDGSANVAIAMTAKIGSDTININGNVTSNSDDTLSDSLNFTGAISVSCNFNHDDLSICPDFASACGISSSAICTGNDYRTDVCQ